MKDFLSRIQKDFKLLQSTIEKEGNELITKAKKAANDIANNNNVKARTREIEKLLESKFKKFEPALMKFISEVSKNAGKYGIDVKDLEGMVRTSVKKAKTRFSGTKKSTGKSKAKGTAKSKTKASAKKSPAKKSTTKKSTAKQPATESAGTAE